MSMIGDWINTTPAAKRTTFNPIFPNGVLKKPGSEAGLSCGIANPFMFSLCVCVCVSSKPLYQNSEFVFNRTPQSLASLFNELFRQYKPSSHRQEGAKKKKLKSVRRSTPRLERARAPDILLYFLVRFGQSHFFSSLSLSQFLQLICSR